MAQDAASIHQFRALAAIEKAFAENPDLVGPALDRMSQPLDLEAETAVGVEAGTRALGAPDPFAHLREHWLSGAYFPNIAADTITEQLMKGFREAVQAVRETKKQFVPVWVCATDDSSASVFRVDHVVTETSVVLAIVTPRPAR
jgi:hypothetical protein